MPSGIRTRYNVALNGRGFMLRGSPQNPAYSKTEVAINLSNADANDPSFNPLNGADWLYWAQTDWSGGFQQLKWKDNASFRDGQSVNLLDPYGNVKMQNLNVSVAQISGSHKFGAYAVHGNDLLVGTIKAGAAKVSKVTSADAVSTLSGMAGISAVNSMHRFTNVTLIGMTRTSGTAKTLAKYNGSVVSGFRNANPIVRAVRGVGIRAYTSEFVSSLSGDVLYYSTDLSTFTSAYQAGKGNKMPQIQDLNGTPYLFVQDFNKVKMYRFDEYQSKVFPIYEFSDLTSWGVTNYQSMLVITGTSNGKRIAYAFNGARIWQIFVDQLLDTTYDFSKPFVFDNQLHVKGAFWDGQAWFPGLTSPVNAVVGSTKVGVPFANFAGQAYSYYDDTTVMWLSKLSTTKYPNSGFVIGSDFGSAIGYVDKLVNAVTINCKPLSASETIEYFRSTDGGATFTSVGKLANATDGAISSKTLYFPSGFITKKWLYKIQMAVPGGTILHTPTLLDVVHQYRPVPDLKSRWSLAIQADDGVKLLNDQKEQRKGNELVSELWFEKQKKQTMIFEDINAVSAKFISAMTSANTSAAVASTDHFPRRGRIRVVVSGVAEEMTYTSADGKKVYGITRGQKGTKARAYTTSHVMDNNYTVVVTDMRQSLLTTDEDKTESVAYITLLEV